MAPELQVHTRAGLLLSLCKLLVASQALTVLTIPFRISTCKQERTQPQHNTMGETIIAAVREHRSSSPAPAQHPSHPIPASQQAAPGELRCISQCWACSESPGRCSAGWAIVTRSMSRAISTCPFSSGRWFLSQTSASARFRRESCTHRQPPGRGQLMGSTRESKYDIFQWDGICPKPIHCHIPKNPLGCAQQWLGALLHKKSIQILSFSFFY